MAQLNLSSEDKLLVYCSRLSISDDIRHKITEILSSELDWNYIIDCSVKQGISPLLYWNLRKISTSENIPSEIVQKLEKMYYSNLARNLIRYKELHKILAAFKKVSIDTVVFKGAFLAEKIYRNIGLRPMADVDLLIKEKDLEQAKIELANLMYSKTNIFPTKLHEQQYRVRSGEMTFISQQKNIFIDIHWDIQPHVYTYKVNVNKYWNNTKPIRIANVEILTFACEDMLQHLCLHVDKHVTLSSAFSYVPPAKPLRDYCDIAEVIKYYKNTIDWDYILQSSNSQGIKEPVYQGLFIAKNYFGAIVPESVLSNLEPTEHLSPNFEEIYKGTMKEDHEKEDHSDEAIYFTNLKMTNGYHNKARVIFGDIFPSKEFMMYYYSIKSKKEVYIYYLVRIRKGFRTGLKLLHKLPHYLLKSDFSK